MKRAKLSRSAANYLRQEVAFVAERSPAAAEKIRARLNALRDILADHPEVGKRSDLQGIRTFADAKFGYVLTYRISGGEVEIASLRHGRQEPIFDIEPGDDIDDEPDDSTGMKP